MKAIKFLQAFFFAFFIGMFVSNISLDKDGFSFHSSVAEASQQRGGITIDQPDLGLITNKSPIQNFIESNNKVIRGLLVVFSVIAGFTLFIAVGLDLKQRADQGSVKSPGSKIVATILAATIVMNFYRALGWFVPNGDSCTLSGFQSGECGNTPMSVTGALADDLMGSAASAGNAASGGNLAFLGDTYSTVNSVSYLIMAIGAASFISMIFLMKKMYANEGEKKDIAKLGRIALASVAIINHRALIEGGVYSLKLMGFWA